MKYEYIYGVLKHPTPKKKKKSRKEPIRNGNCIKDCTNPLCILFL